VFRKAKREESRRRPYRQHSRAVHSQECGACERRLTSPRQQGRGFGKRDRWRGEGQRSSFVRPICQLYLEMQVELDCRKRTDKRVIGVNMKTRVEDKINASMRATSFGYTSRSMYMCVGSSQCLNEAPTDQTPHKRAEDQEVGHQMRFRRGTSAAAGENSYLIRSDRHAGNSSLKASTTRSDGNGRYQAFRVAVLCIAPRRRWASVVRRPLCDWHGAWCGHRPSVVA